MIIEFFKKVHRVKILEQNMFKTIQWIKYKKLNESNDYEQEKFKFMNNSFYRKTCENVRKPWNLNILKKEKKEIYQHQIVTIMGYSIFRIIH